MSALKSMAVETVGIVERGEYVAPSGRTVTLKEDVARATRGTRLYRPGDFGALAREAAGTGAPRLGRAP